VVLGSVPFVTPSATAAVPTFPDNLVVFPDRDFVTVEGYQDHIGETATVDILRGTTKIGSAQGVVQEGDVAFEINHPGGSCWGAGTTLKVTPDIRGGDVAKISFGGQVAGDSKVLDTFATDVSYTPGSTSLTVSGHVGSDVVPAQMEQRIVNPSLVGTSVARRDVRAVPGPMTRAARGGYSSALAVTGTTFTATYEFDEAAVAKTAAEGGGARVMAWQEEDADANRQGLTIAELGEAGGPGMGGCPAGPADQAAPAGSFSAIRSADKATYQVNWTAATPQPGAAPVTGYSIEAIAPADATGAQKTVGARTGASATRSTLTVDAGVAPYTVEVRSIAGGRMSDAFTPVSAPPDAPPTDQTAPTVTASPAPNADPDVPVEATSVTLTSETGADIYYTTDASPAVTGDLPSDGAKLYTGPIPIAAQTDLRWVAFDRAGNFAIGQGTYAPNVTPVPVPTQLSAPSATAGQESVTLRWAASPASQGVTTYGVQVYRGGIKDGAVKETEATQLTVTPLTADTAYSFTVAAKNSAGYGAESSKSPEVTPTKVTDRVTITKATWKTGDFRIVGTGTVPGAIVSAYRVNTDGTVGSPITGGSASVAQPVAPSTVGAYDLRIRTGAPAANPGRIFVKSDKGGLAGPFSVTNG
jgi:hypothetical protein